METNDRTPAPVDALQELLDQAARAYMSARYDAAVSLWKQALEIDPENSRSREGIKKVDMLHSGDGISDEAPANPVLDRIEAMLAERQFEAAVHACVSHSEGASPSVRTHLGQLREQAERARAVEPEIRHALLAARRALKEGKVKDAIPQLKRVLALDKDHPVATRLMAAMRERLQRRNVATRPVVVESDGVGVLPASGHPGSDAPPFNVMVGAEHELPAPAGQGLPSSPPFVPETEAEPRPDAAPDLALESFSIDEPVDLLPPTDIAAVAPEPVADDDLLVDDPVPIELQETETFLPRVARAGATSESPFAADAREETAGLVPDGKPSPVPAVADAGDLVGSVAEIPGVASPEPTRDALAHRTPSRGARSGRGRTGVLVVAAAAALVAAVWWFELVPGLSTPTARPQPALPAAVLPPEIEAREPAGDTESATPSPAVPAVQSDHDPVGALGLFEAGQDAFEAGEIGGAMDSFEKALRLDPMNAEISDWLEKVRGLHAAERAFATEQNAALSAFRKKDFAEALRGFYRLNEQEPGGSFEAQIATTWFNWGLSLLAAGNLREAAVKMGEALAIRPDDKPAQEVLTLIGIYISRPKDRVFYQRVEALRYRTLD